MSGLSGNLFGKYINWLFNAGDISVPSDFHGRCNAVDIMIDDDVTGVVNSLLNYGVESASETKYRIECNDKTLQKLLNRWLSEINISISGIPTGLQELSKEYFKERWQGSSFCLLRASEWKSIKVDGVGINVPKVMWFANGSSIHVKRLNGNYKLGTDKYYLDNKLKNQIVNSDKQYFTIQKPFNRWFDQYATPYLIKNGVYKNWKALKTLMGKSDNVISKFIPYLFLMNKGTLEEYLKADVTYDNDELNEMVNNFKDQMEKYENQKSKIPAHGMPFDQKYTHLIPDLTKILNEELYRQGYRAILAGLGFIDVIQGISSTRKESILNPKPFISGINDGVSGFKSLLLDVIYQIIDRNKKEHKKLFSEKHNIVVSNSPLKINIEQILDNIRGAFDRGSISIQSYAESLGFDFETEKERRQKEANNGMEDLFYPHITVNKEDKGKDLYIQPSKPKTKKEENLDKEGKKPNTPDAKNYKNAEEETSSVPKQDIAEELMEIAPFTKTNYPKYLDKYPSGAIEVFIKTFNKVYEKTQDESKAYPIAWNALKRWMKKHNYKFKSGIWEKQE